MSSGASKEMVTVFLPAVFHSGEEELVVGKLQGDCRFGILDYSTTQALSYLFRLSLQLARSRR